MLWRHALRPSSVSLLASAGITIGGLIAGTLVVETLLQLPGIGYQLISSINQDDYTVVQGMALVIAVAVVLIISILLVIAAAGIISLAVPLSTSFAGEFLILAGVFQQHWAWAVVGATGIVPASSREAISSTSSSIPSFRNAEMHSVSGF